HAEPHDVATRLFVAVEHELAATLSFFQQRVERTETVIGFVEPGLAALQRLLDHRTPDFFLGTALAQQRVDRLHNQVDRLVAPLVFALERYGERDAFLCRQLAASYGRFLDGLSSARSRLRRTLACAPACRRFLFFAHQIVVVD